MPTENRSSNTEMVSVPRQTLENVLRDGSCKRETNADFLQAQQRIRTLLDQPAPQPHPEPIAWMVGTAIWWTKEEAERDAAATGLPIVGLGPMTDTAEVDRLRAERRRMDDALVACSNERDSLGAELAQCEAMAAMVAEREWAEHVGTGPVSGKVEAAFTQLHNDLHEADDKLAERDALLDRVVDHAKFWHDHPYAEVVEGIAKDYKALSASAVPSAPTPQTINGHKLNCKAVDDYKPGDCSCGAEPDSKS